MPFPAAPKVSVDLSWAGGGWCPGSPLSTAVSGGLWTELWPPSPVLGSCLLCSWSQGCPKTLLSSFHPITLLMSCSCHMPQVILDGGGHKACVLRSTPHPQLPGLGHGFREVWGDSLGLGPGLVVAVGAHSSYFSLLVFFSQG